MMTRILVSGLFGSLCATYAWGQDEHPIKFDRLLAAGSVIEVSSRTEQVGNLGPVLARPNRWGVTGSFRTVGVLVIQIAVSEVNAQGFAKEATFRIVRCDVVSGGARTARDLPGKVFRVAASDGMRRYMEPTGAAGEWYVLDPPRASILDLAVPLRFLEGEAGLDAMFGVAAPQKKGAEWNADPQSLADGFTYLGAAKVRAQGAATLKQATAKLLTLESSLQLAGLKYEFPAGYTLATDQFRLRYVTSLPTDATALPTEQSIAKYTAVEGTADGKRGTEWMRESGVARYKRLK